MSTKPIYAKPALYAFYYETLKGIAKEYGYNLVLHGSMARDLDLIAIPWSAELGDVDEMVTKFAEVLGGWVMPQTEAQMNCFPHGRQSRIVNINRDWIMDKNTDQQYYIDISIIPVPENINK